jgi:DNA-binding NarL/FixJ family response regulator
MAGRAVMRVLVVDDHPLLRDALAQVVQDVEPQAEVLRAGDCEQALALAEADPRIDLLLLDLNLPGLAGIPALKAWRQRHPDVPVMVLSADGSQPTVLAALSAGAAGFVPKSTPSALMAGALRLVLDGGRYLPPEVLGTPPAARGGARPPAPKPATLGLTPRQLEVLRLLAGGAPNNAIARELGMAERTVKAHVTAALRALRVSSRTQLALEAARLGLLPRNPARP